MKACTFQAWPQNFFAKKNFLYFFLKKTCSEKVPYIFSKKLLTFWKRKPGKSSLYFRKWNFLRSRSVYTFSYKEVKFFELKYCLIIIIWHFFSFYNIFFYTQQAFFFPLLSNFCNVHDHIVAFFSFLERFWYLSQAFFCYLSLFSWKYDIFI